VSTLLEKALAKVSALPEDEQDAIASEILSSMADEEAWKRKFAEKRDVIRRMAQEALNEDDQGKTLPLGGLLYLVSSGHVDPLTEHLRRADYPDA